VATTELIGTVATLSICVIGVVFRVGHHTARIEELEKWRGSIRQDMHDISDRIGAVGEELKRLSTLIEERTSRAQQRQPEQR